MEQKKSIDELRDGVIAEMVNRGYKISTIQNFRKNCRSFSQYLQKHGLPPEFTESMGASYLSEIFGYDEHAKTEQISAYAISNVNTISKLGEYKLYGTFHTKIQSWTESCWWACGDKSYVERYIEYDRGLDKSENTIKGRLHALRYFYEYLGACGCSGITDVNGRILSDYINSRKGNSHNYICNLLTSLKLYFRFLYHQGLCEENLELLVPIMRSRKNLNVIALWSEDELRTLLNSIDRSSPVGKRDYAVLLLAVQLGIRISDIASLKLSNLDFDHKTIGFTQVKTEKAVTYPMLDDVGWALIDWIRHGRPNVENPYVFLICHGVPTEFADGNALSGILRRRMKSSGIRKEAKNTTAGMHSLRHALARRLVENDTRLYDVVSIMGHRTTDATSKYARTDMQGLRDCALSIGG